MCLRSQRRSGIQASKHLCKHCKIKAFHKIVFQLFYENGNTFNSFVRHQGYTQCFFSEALYINITFVCKKLPQGTFNVLKAGRLIWRGIGVSTGDKLVFHDPQLKAIFTNIYHGL